MIQEAIGYKPISFLFILFKILKRLIIIDRLLLDKQTVFLRRRSTANKVTFFTQEIEFIGTQPKKDWVGVC